MPRPWYIAPSIVPLMRCSCPVPLAEKHPQSIMFWPSCLTVGMVFLGSWQHSSSSKHGELSWSQRPGFWSHLTTTPSPSSPLNHWQTSDGPVHAADFSPSRRSVLPIVFLVTMVPAVLRFTKVCNLAPDILGQLFGLGHGGEFRIWLIDCFCGQVVFYTGNKQIRSTPFKRVLLISALYLYKRHLGVRNLADW